MIIYGRKYFEVKEIFANKGESDLEFGRVAGRFARLF